MGHNSSTFAIDLDSFEWENESCNLDNMCLKYKNGKDVYYNDEYMIVSTRNPKRLKTYCFHLWDLLETTTRMCK